MQLYILVCHNIDFMHVGINYSVLALQAQYRTVFEAVLMFLTTFDLYENFQTSRETV